MDEITSTITSAPPEFLTWKDLDGRFSAIEWMWSGWIAKGLLTLIAGPPASGKSNAVLGLVKVVLHGGQWPDGTTYQHENGSEVAWIETEGGESINIPRANALGIDTARIRTVYTRETEGAPINLGSEAHRSAILELARRPQTHLVVIDSLSGGHSVNENESSVGKVVQSVAQIGTITQTPIILVSHTNKASMHNDTPRMSDVRGSSTQLQYPRVIAGVDAPNPQTPDLRRITCTKNNIMAAPDPVGFRLTSNGVEWCEPPTAPAGVHDPTQRAGKHAEVRELLASGHSYSEVSAMTGYSKGAIHKIMHGK